MFGTVVVTRLSSVIMIRFGNLRAVELVSLWSWDCYSWLGICWLFVVELWSCPALSNYITTMRYYGSYGWLNILCQFTDVVIPMWIVSTIGLTAPTTTLSVLAPIVSSMPFNPMCHFGCLITVEICHYVLLTTSEVCWSVLHVGCQPMVSAVVILLVPTLTSLHIH